MTTTVSIILALFGAIVIAVGGLFATRYWEKYFLSPAKKQKQMASIWLVISLIAMMVGGFLSTYYWNVYFNLEEFKNRRESIIYMVTQEIVQNVAIMHTPPFLETEEKKLSGPANYPRFQTTALSALLSSGQFIGSNDRELLRITLDLVAGLNEINSMLDLTETIIMTNPDPELRLSWRKAVRNGKVLKDARSLLKNLLELLKSKYGVTREEYLSLLEENQ